MPLTTTTTRDARGTLDELWIPANSPCSGLYVAFSEKGSSNVQLFPIRVGLPADYPLIVGGATLTRRGGGAATQVPGERLLKPGASR